MADYTIRTHSLQAIIRAVGIAGTKNSAFEGGQRVPFIAVWPSVIAANTTSDALVNGTDILATIAETRKPAFSQALDSHSLFPLFLGNTSYEPRSELMQQEEVAVAN